MYQSSDSSNRNKKSALLSIGAIAIMAIVCVALVCVILNSFLPEKADGISTTLPEQTISTQPATSVPSTLSDYTTVPTTIGQITEITESSAPVGAMTTITIAPTLAAEKSTQEICDSFNRAVNDIKNNMGSFSIHKVQKVDVSLTEFSLPAPTETINSLIKNVVDDSESTYSFNNGVQVDDAAHSVSSRISPCSRNASVVPSNLKAATSEMQGDKEVIKLSFVSDTSYFDGNVTAYPMQISGATDPLDFSVLPMGPLSISNADITYPDTQVEAVISGDGRLEKLTVILPTIVDCTGGMSVFTADIGLDIKVTTVFNISYN